MSNYKIIQMRAQTRLREVFGLMFALLFFFPNLSSAQLVSAPIEVISASQFNQFPDKLLQPDAPLVPYVYKSMRYWLLASWDRAHGTIVHTRSKGDLDSPLRSVEWVKTRDQLFHFHNSQKPVFGDYWIVNLYQDADGLLAFVHVENVQGFGKGGANPGQTGKSRIGLAWSRDGGNTFDYLGHILAPSGDPNPHNIQGAPYVTKDGYFYVYFNDKTGLTVARAPIKEVLTAAKAGKITSWKKYRGSDQGFNGEGLGGPSTSIGVDGISHSDAACSFSIGKCYLVLTRMDWGMKDAWISLFQSEDAIHWEKIRVIAQQAPTVVGAKAKGFQYATIVNADGTDNGEVGDRFFLYVTKNHLDDSRVELRWSVDLNERETTQKAH